MSQITQNATGSPGLYGQDDRGDWPERDVEAYTVALSVSGHLLALIAGGSSNLALLIAMGARSRAGSKLSARGYSQVLTLVGACLLLCLLWSPLEVVDLLTFHHTGHHMFTSHVSLVSKASLHVFLLTLICAVLVLLAGEAALRLVATSSQRRNSRNVISSFASRWCGSGHGNRLWPPVASLLAVLLALFLSIGYITTSNVASSAGKFYVALEQESRTFFLALTSLIFCLVLVAGLVLLVLLLKETLFCENGRLRFKRRPSVKLVIPDFLISQSATTAAENTGGYEPSTATPSPSTPKLLAVVGAETAGDEVSPISDLPAAKSLGSRLGVNMAQVLGRRRHTICQIGDSGAGGGVTAGGGSGNDPIGKAKQYNYVRKFSVDISALQAQLQNPKIFKDAPFQSDVDLTKKPAGDGGAGGAGQSAQAGKTHPEPLLPLKPLPKRFEAKGGGGGGGGGALGAETLKTENPAQGGTPPPALKNGPTKTAGSPGSGDRDIPASCAVVQTPPQPPPPVIMVSTDEDNDVSNLQIHHGDGLVDESKGSPQTLSVDETTPLNPDENTNTISAVSSPPKTEDSFNVTTAVTTTTTSSPSAKKPTSLAFTGGSQQQQQQQQQQNSSCVEEDSVENHTQGATFDSDMSYASGDGDDGERATAVRMSQLVLLLILTFLLALLPVAVTEMVREKLSDRTFVNTRACVLSVWALQTLLYPHLLAWGDRNLHRAVRRLKRSFTTALEGRVGTLCCPCCCSETGESRIRHIEDTSSISQV